MKCILKIGSSWRYVRFINDGNLYYRRFEKMNCHDWKCFAWDDKQNPAANFEKFVKRNKPLSTRRVLSFLKWDRYSVFERNFWNLPNNQKYVSRFCGNRQYGKELIDLIDKRIKSFPDQTDHKLAELLKLTIEKTFVL